VSAHGSLDHVRSMEHLLVVITFHPSTGSLNVFAVVFQNFVDFFILIGNLLPVKDNSSPIEKTSVDQEFRWGTKPSVRLPADVAQRILHKPEEIFEPSSFVAFVNGFFAESVFFQLPVVLLSHGPVIISTSTCRSSQAFQSY